MLNPKKKQQGFTIIEVLIVLAIAGLIMLIVFLAVPALNRNSRNTQRTNDVGRIGGAVQEVLNNNDGSLTSVTSANIQGALGSKLSYYTVSNVTVATPSGTATNGTTLDTVNVYMGALCADLGGGGGRGAISTGATQRQVAIVYTVETGSGTNKNCTQS